MWYCRCCATISRGTDPSEFAMEVGLLQIDTEAVELGARDVAEEVAFMAL